MKSPQPSTPYLVIGPDAPPAPVRRVLARRLNWKKVATAVIAGGLLGGVVGLLQPSPDKQVPVAVSVKSAAAADPVDARDVQLD